MSIENEINSFLMVWGSEELSSFLQDSLPLFELYDVDENSDWVEDVVGKEDAQNVRLIRTVYLVSRLAEHHAEGLSKLNNEFKDLWKRMEEYGQEDQEATERH